MINSRFFFSYHILSPILVAISTHSFNGFLYKRLKCTTYLISAIVLIWTLLLWFFLFSHFPFSHYHFCVIAVNISWGIFFGLSLINQKYNHNSTNSLQHYWISYFFALTRISNESYLTFSLSVSLDDNISLPLLTAKTLNISRNYRKFS